MFPGRELSERGAGEIFQAARPRSKTACLASHRPSCEGPRVHPAGRPQQMVGAARHTLPSGHGPHSGAGPVDASWGGPDLAVEVTGLEVRHASFNGGLRAGSPLDFRIRWVRPPYWNQKPWKEQTFKTLPKTTQDAIHVSVLQRLWVTGKLHFIG